MEKKEQKLPQETKKSLIKSVQTAMLETSKLLQTSGGKGATIIGATAMGRKFGISTLQY